MGYRDNSDRLGEVNVNKKGQPMRILNYHKSNNIDVQFEDGCINYGIEYSRFKEGRVANPCDKPNRLGEKHVTNQGYIIEIIEYYNATNCTVLFTNGLIFRNRQYSEIKRGTITNPFHPTTFNIGYFGIGKYVSEINGVATKYYTAWKWSIERCYTEKFHKKYPSYIGCSVDEKWHNFQVFAEWFHQNFNPETMQGWHLDKDILVKGNKVYSPETCCFVPHEINGLFVKNNRVRGKYPIGVHKKGNKYKAQIVCNNIVRYLGAYDTPEEAFQVYKTAKENHIKEVADKWRGLISDKVYKAMYNYKVEITD